MQKHLSRRVARAGFSTVCKLMRMAGHRNKTRSPSSTSPGQTLPDSYRHIWPMLRIINMQDYHYLQTDYSHRRFKNEDHREQKPFH